MASASVFCQSKVLHCIGVILILFSIAISSACSSPENFVEPAPIKSAISAQETININTAGKEELQRIPYVGEKMADAIITHREKFGAFSRPEHLILLNGFSDERFRRIRHLISID